MLGVFRVSLKVTSPDDLLFKKAIEIQAWVDTGSTFTSVPISILTKLGIKPFRSTELELGDGRLIKRKIGSAEKYTPTGQLKSD